MVAVDAFVLFLILTENVLSASSLCEMLTLGLRWTHFVILRRHILLKLFYQGLILNKIFSIYEDIHSLSF